jgi:hypothetical protein
MKFKGLIVLAALAGSVALAADSTTQPSEQPAASSAAPATQPSGGNSPRNLSAEQMLSRMLKSPPTAAKPLQPVTDSPGPDSKSGAGAIAPNAPTVTVLREGTFIVDRVGRLSRNADGSQAEFQFDSDSKAMKDPPVIILPNQKLMSMENAVGSASRDLRFRITGMLTEYHSRNYILLDKVVVVPDPAQQF